MDHYQLVIYSCVKMSPFHIIYQTKLELSLDNYHSAGQMIYPSISFLPLIRVWVEEAAVQAPLSTHPGEFLKAS